MIDSIVFSIDPFGTNGAELSSYNEQSMLASKNSSVYSSHMKGLCSLPGLPMDDCDGRCKKEGYEYGSCWLRMCYCYDP